MKISDTKIRGLEFTDFIKTGKDIRNGTAVLLKGTLVYNIGGRNIFIQNSLVAEELCHPRKYEIYRPDSNRPGNNGLLSDDFFKYLFQKINTFMINNNLNEFIYDLDNPKNIEGTIGVKDTEIKQYSKIQEFNNFSIAELNKLYLISNNYKTDIVLLTYLKGLGINVYQLIYSKDGENKFNLFKYFANIDLQNINSFVVSDFFDKLLIEVFNAEGEKEVKQYVIDNITTINRIFANNSNKIELSLKVKFYQENITKNDTAITIQKEGELSYGLDKMIFKDISKLGFNELIKNRLSLKEQMEKDLDGELTKLILSKIKGFTKEMNIVNQDLYTCIEGGSIERKKGTLADTYSSQKEKDLTTFFSIFSDNFELFKKMVSEIKIYSIYNYISLYQKHFFDNDKKDFLINIIKNSNKFRFEVNKDDRITNESFSLEFKSFFWIDNLDKKEDINYVKDVDKIYFQGKLNINLYFSIFFRGQKRIDKLNDEIINYFLFEKMKLNNSVSAVNDKIYKKIVDSGINEELITLIDEEWIIGTISSEINYLFFELFLNDLKNRYLKKIGKYKFNKILIEIYLYMSKKAKERYFGFNNFQVKSEYFEIFSDSDNLTEEQALELFNAFSLNNIDMKVNIYKYTKKGKIIINFGGNDDLIRAFLEHN